MVPPAGAVTGACLVTDTSASGLTTVISDAVLLSGFGSSIPAGVMTVPAAVIVPLTGAVAVMVNAALPPDRIGALVHVAVVLVFCTQPAPQPVIAPFETEADTVAVDAAGPALVTV